MANIPNFYDDQLTRTKGWAQAFADSALEMESQDCPADIDPILWQAQIDACRSQSADLWEQAKKLEANKDGQ